MANAAQPHEAPDATAPPVAKGGARGKRGRDAEGEGSERSCIVTRARLDPEAMIRFVLDPSGQVTPDIRRKLPGRGVWVTASAAMVAQAVAKGAFSRGFKAPARAAEDLPALVGRLLEEDALQSLAMANKSGAVISGGDKVEKAALKGQIEALVLASDAGADGRRRMAQLARRVAPSSAPIVTVESFASSQLDLALGRTNVIHAALKYGPACEAFLRRERRLAIFHGVAEASQGLTSGEGQPSQGAVSDGQDSPGTGEDDAGRAGDDEAAKGPCPEVEN